MISRDNLYLSTFIADITCPIGHPLMGGGIAPAQRVEDPLLAHGFVLFGEIEPIVLAAIDWCEIRNDAHDRWKEALAEVAHTIPDRVLIASVHQHDAPIADLEAQRLLERNKASGKICDIDFHEQAVQNVAHALRNSLQSPRKISHFGIGQAKVDKVASNRRYLNPDGKVSFGRTSATRDLWAREQPEGLIDPWLKTLSFWDDDRPLLALNCYATHPMSYYGKGGVSSDFVGLARKHRQDDNPSLFQIYASGCSGNVAAGKYNDGTPENRPILADRLYQAMVSAWNQAQSRRYSLEQLDFRTVAMRLEPRNSPGFTVEDLDKRLKSDLRPFGQCLAALGLSWHKRADSGYKIEIPLIDFGQAKLLLMPGETYVEYQLLAQKIKPDSFVVVMGYGECAPGYIPTDKHFEEGDTNLNDWCWVAPGAEQAMTEALKRALY